jgi:hypothetical protein
MGVSNGDEDGGGVDGDGSGGNSPSQQGAETETSISRNWSSMAAALQNFSSIDAVAYLCFICDSPGSTTSTHSYKMKYQECKGLYYNA